MEVLFLKTKTIRGIINSIESEDKKQLKNEGYTKIILYSTIAGHRNNIFDKSYDLEIDRPKVKVINHQSFIFCSNFCNM